MTGKKLAGAMIAVVLVSMMFVSGAAASSGGANVTVTDNNSTYVVHGHVKNKKQWSKNFDANHGSTSTASTGSVTTQSTQTQTDTNSGSMTYNGQQMQVLSKLHGVMYTGFYKATLTLNGSTKGRWWGSTPYNADSITLTSQDTFSGNSMTFSVPTGVTFQQTGSTFTYTGTWSNTWSVNHYFSGLEATSSVYIDGASQDDSATFRFGSSDYQPYDQTSVFL